ncbi:hypothetical protein GQ600_2402 [Phytophthora cactorum]|nr:hypothetical protein GQ600_2402 [Phytophthora cactorum]
MSSNSCSSKSGHCAFCGESLVTRPRRSHCVWCSTRGRSGNFTKLKPLRWRFLTNKAPRTKYMCSACARSVQVPQKTEQPVSLDSSWDGSQKHSEPALRLEHLESHDAVRQQRKSQRMQSEKIEKLQERYPERRENRRSTREPLSSNGRRRGSSQTSEAQHDSARRSSVLQPFANHRKSRESIIRNRPASTVEIRTRTSVTNQRASVESDATEKRPVRRTKRKKNASDAKRVVRPHAGAHETSNNRAGEWNPRSPVTAPPRRIRAERRAKSVAVHSVKEDEPVKMDPADFAVDLDYLRAYKDARRDGDSELHFMKATVPVSRRRR